MLGADPFRLAGVRLLGDELVQPDVARLRDSAMLPPVRR